MRSPSRFRRGSGSRAGWPSAWRVRLSRARVPYAVTRS